MQIQLLDLGLVITRLKTSSLLTAVGGAADLASAEQDIKRPPAAYVIPINDAASDNTFGTQIVEQHVQTQFGVVFAVSNKRDMTGQAAIADLRSVRMDAMALLLGWLPTGMDDLVIYRSGRLLRMQNTILWWQEQYATGFYIRS